MNWMVASIAASAVAISGPLFMVESIPAIRAASELAPRRRQLRAVTAGVLVLVGLWLWFDRAAVGLGARSLLVSAVAVTVFFLLLGAFAYPLLRRAAAIGAEPGSPPVPVPFLRAPLDVPALLLVLAAVVAYVLSSNDFGHRVKGAATVLAGVTLYFLGRPRAPWTAVVFAFSGAITLFADWSISWQRTVGVGGQLTVGLLGFAWCARLVVGTARSSAPPKRPHNVR